MLLSLAFIRSPFKKKYFKMGGHRVCRLGKVCQGEEGGQEEGRVEEDKGRKKAHQVSNREQTKNTVILSKSISLIRKSQVDGVERSQYTITPLKDKQVKDMFCYRKELKKEERVITRNR